MKNELQVREIKFEGKKIVTALIDEKVYISIKSICDNLGMSNDQYKAQKLKVRNDELLKVGIKLYPLNTGYGIKETMMLELDYLPIWLAKINPSRFTNELREQLLNYQLRAKDVLADEFLGKRPKQLIRYEPELNEIEDRIARIRANRNTVRELLVQIANDYNWIDYRAGLGYERAKSDYQQTKRTHFILEGENLTLEDIDRLNEDALERTKKDLES